MEDWKSAGCGNTEHCQACGTNYGIDTSSDEFLVWWEGLQAPCEVNYYGSSSVIESTWAIAIWKLSVSKNKLRYTQMISDGDSKTFKLALWCVQPGKQAIMCGACGRKNGNGTKRECKGEVCEWEGRVCEDEDEGEGAAHRQIDKTVDSLLWQIHQIQHRWLCGNAGWSGLCFTTPSPQTAVHSTSIAPELAVLMQLQQGTCQFRVFPTPLIHHPSRHCSPLKRSFATLSPYTDGALCTWCDSESERVIQ